MIDNPKIYQNRELSWLKFNYRVLQQARDSNVPLFERMRFLSIFSSNLDEFFMIRVGSLYDQSLFDPDKIDNKSGLTPGQQLQAILEETRRLVPVKDETYAQLMNALSFCGMTQVRLSDLDPADYEFLKSYFEQEIKPLVSPQIIDKQHPFPFLKNKEIYIGVHLATKGHFVKFAVIPASGSSFNRVIYLPGGKGIRFVLAEDLIWYFCDSIFSNYSVVEKTVFRITRNADIDVEEALDDHDLDFREAMERIIKERRKLAAVRLELFSKINVDLMQYLSEKLMLSPEQIFITTAPLDMSFVFAVESKIDNSLPELFYGKLIPQRSTMLDERSSYLAQIRDHDVFLSYPYESIRPFTRLLYEAAENPDVISIKITLYRVAKGSQIVDALTKAAENGKSVTALVELKARFDEENNIGWSRRLQAAGCNVIYGLPGYKVHSKLLLITLRSKESGKVEYVTQIGTGNYNENTARLYTDVSLITANHQIAMDAVNVFNCLAIGTTVDQTTDLLVAPHCLKDRLMNLVQGEINRAKMGEGGHIIAKFNSFTDKELLDKFVEASKAGVRIELIIRGICCLKPGIEGYTDNIKVISIVGRFLEHSRIFVFGDGESRKIYISSADLMTRNTERRVEVAAPIYDPAIQKRVMDMLRTILSDNVKAQQLLPSGEYHWVKSEGKKIDSQIALYEQAYREAAMEQSAREEQVSTPRMTAQTPPVVKQGAEKSKAPETLTGRLKRWLHR